MNADARTAAQVEILEVMRNSSQKVHDEVADNDPNAAAKRLANAYVVKLCDAYILDLEAGR